MFFIAASCTLNMIGDRNCNKECNTADYDYDSGACCYPVAQKVGDTSELICFETNGYQIGLKLSMKNDISFE